MPIAMRSSAGAGLRLVRAAGLRLAARQRVHATHASPLKIRRERLLNAAQAATAGGHGELGMLLGQFMLAQVPELSEPELAEMERVLVLSEAELQSLTERPGTDATRPGIVRGNSMLDRFLNFARFRGDTSGEFR